MGDKSRGSLISSRSAEQPDSPIESWMGSRRERLRVWKPPQKPPNAPLCSSENTCA
jgi:hypothetical protein